MSENGNLFTLERLREEAEAQMAFMRLQMQAVEKLAVEAEARAMKYALSLGQQQARITELEAACAAKDEAIRDFLDLIRQSDCVSGRYFIEYPEDLEAALTTDAGAKLLARLRAAERVARVARLLYKQWPNYHESKTPTWRRLREALVSWEETTW